LGGQPGVDSAHFAGPERDNDANNRLVLERLSGVPEPKRGARYVCHVTLCDASGEVRAEAAGECRGRIGAEPRGGGGFGYDPLFEVREYHRTFGQMGPAVKRALSHRSRAMRAILPQVARLVRAQ
ncbi:MAG: non-canonical purine NTP pyrophosphatase, partial [Planctomycetota bacterium]